MFNADPPQKSSPMPLWSLNDLLDYLNCDIFEPLFNKSFDIITQKLLCLLLLATGRRIDEVGHLSRKHSDTAQGNAIKLFCVEGFVPKHFDQAFKPKNPVIDRLDSNGTEDGRLCPVRAFNIYIQHLGGNPRQSVKVPLWNLDTKGLTKLFCSVVLQSRVRKNIHGHVSIGPHQVRKLAASYSAVLMGQSKDLERTLMDRMGCASMFILKKNYICHVPPLNVSCVLPVGTFKTM